MQIPLRSRVQHAVYAAFGAGLLLGVAGTVIGASMRGSDVFSDVPRGAYYDDAIGELYQAGILKGANGKFRPADSISRADFAVAIRRLRAELLGIPLDEAPSAPAPVDNPEPSPPPTDAPASTASRSRRSKASSSAKSSSSKPKEVGPQGAFTFTVDKIAIPESAKGITVGVQRVEGDSDDVAVTFEAVGGIAKIAEDFYKNTTTLKFADGETSKTVSVLFINDTVKECNETFTIQLRDPTNDAVLGKITVVTVTIIDNEPGSTPACDGAGSSGSSTSAAGSSSAASSVTAAGEFSYSALTYMVNESGGTVTLTVNRTKGSAGTATVNYATADVLGKAGTDYLSTAGTLTFADGETSKTMAVTIVDNAVIGGNKTFKATLSVPTGGATLGRTKDVIVTIFDNESASYGNGSLKFTKSAYDGSENAGYAYAVVQRVGGANGIATVTYTTTSGTASGNDFTPISGSLTFLAGESSKELVLPLADDTQNEGTETAFLNLSSPIGAELTTPNSTTINIHD